MWFPSRPPEPTPRCLQRSLLLEEGFHKVGALGFEHATGHLCLRVKQRIADAAVAALLIERAEDDATDVAPVERACAHDARLNGNVPVSYTHLSDVHRG